MQVATEEDCCLASGISIRLGTDRAREPILQVGDESVFCLDSLLSQDISLVFALDRIRRGSLLFFRLLLELFLHLLAFRSVLDFGLLIGFDLC